MSEEGASGPGFAGCNTSGFLQAGLLTCILLDLNSSPNSCEQELLLGRGPQDHRQGRRVPCDMARAVTSQE